MLLQVLYATAMYASTPVHHDGAWSSTIEQHNFAYHWMEISSTISVRAGVSLICDLSFIHPLTKASSKWIRLWLHDPLMHCSLLCPHCLVLSSMPILNAYPQCLSSMPILNAYPLCLSSMLPVGWTRDPGATYCEVHFPRNASGSQLQRNLEY